MERGARERADDVFFAPSIKRRGRKADFAPTWLRGQNLIPQSPGYALLSVSSPAALRLVPGLFVSKAGQASEVVPFPVLPVFLIFGRASAEKPLKRHTPAASDQDSVRQTLRPVWKKYDRTSNFLPYQVRLR